MSRTLRKKGEHQFRMSSDYVTGDDLDSNGRVNLWWRHRIVGMTQAGANRIQRARFHADGSWRSGGPWGRQWYRRKLKSVQRNQLREQLCNLPQDEYDSILIDPHCDSWGWW